MKSHSQFPLLLFIVLTFFGRTQKTTINNLPPDVYADITFSINHYKNFELMSSQFSGLPKVESINNSSPHFNLSSTEFWPIGSWGRGYHTYNTEEIFYKAIGNSKTYYGCHPLSRDASNFIRGHVHIYLSGYHKGNSLELAKKGIDYLLTQIHMSGKDKGGFDLWYFRQDQLNLNMDIPENRANDYETAYALVALSEFYQSKIKHRRKEVLHAIQLSSDYLINRDWKLTNNNVRGLGAWALSNAYKTTFDCISLFKAKQICELMMQEVTRSSNDLNGTWQTGGLDYLDGYGEVNHDTKIFYHIMILRGLIETLDIIPDKDLAFKTDLLETIKIGVNHVINYRLYSEDPKSYQLKYAHKTIDGKIVPWSEYNEMEIEKYIETFSKLAYYATQSSYYSEREKQNLKELLNKISKGISDSNKWHITAFGYYTFYIKSINEKRKTFDWDPNTKCKTQ